MYNNIVYKILAELTEEEYSSLIPYTSPTSHSRRIATLIRKSNGSITKEEIFKRVFKTKRHINNDHLLRNELSILKKRIENFILDRWNTDIPLNATYYKEYVMAQWCLKKVLVPEAEKYIVQAIDIAKSTDGWRSLLNINKVYFHTTQYSKSDYHQKSDLIKKIGEDHILYLKNYIAEEVSYANFIRSGAIKLAANLRQSNQKFTPILSIELDIESQKSKAAKYYHYKAMGYSNSGKEAIRYLEKALQVLQDRLEIYLLKEEEMACMSAIAMEYAVMGELENAIQAFEKIMNHPEFDSFTARNALMLNYTTTLIKVKQYEKAIRCIEKLEELILEPIVIERLYSMKCNCYIFMGQPEKLKKILPINLQSYDVSVRTYYRFLYLIYYILKGNHELAERELTNIRQVRYVDETEFISLVKMFEKYLTAFDAIQYHEKDKSKKINSLKTALINFKKDHTSVSLQLPGMWIIERTEELLKKTNRDK